MLTENCPYGTQREVPSVGAELIKGNRPHERKLENPSGAETAVGAVALATLVLQVISVWHRIKSFTLSQLHSHRDLPKKLSLKSYIPQLTYMFQEHTCSFVTALFNTQLSGAGRSLETKMPPAVSYRASHSEIAKHLQDLVWDLQISTFLAFIGRLVNWGSMS